MIFPPKIIKDMVDKGLLNVNDLNNILYEYNNLLNEYPHNILDELNIKQYRIN